MRRPNLLILMADQMQAGLLEPAHPCRMPHLAALAARGVRFPRGYTPNAVCSPARASLRTGTLPHTHGVLTVNHCAHDYHCDLVPSLPHFAQRLQAVGYRTGYFGKWHVERSNQPDRFGWEVACLTGGGRWRDRAAKAGASGHPPLEIAGYVRGEGWPDALLYGVTAAPPEQRGLGICRALAGEWLHHVTEGDDPWCCFVSVTEPHDPFVCGRAAFDGYDPARAPLPPSGSDDLAGRPGLYRLAQRNFAPLTEDERRLAATCYWALNTEIDAVWGALLEQVDRAGQLAETVVVVLADHGELLGAHGLYQKNVGAFEEVYRIPLLWAGPGVAEGADCAARMGLHDVGPTLLELAGAPPLETHQARSFARLLREPAAVTADDGVGWAEYFGTRSWWSQRILWDGDWKLVWNGFDESELYHLASDPHELRNRLAEPELQPQVRRLMARAYQIVRATDDHPLGQLSYASLRSAPYGPGVEVPA